MTEATEITKILSQVNAGDLSAAEDLLPLVYEELKRLAAARMVAERSDHTLQPTALVHEAYLRLVGAPGGESWKGRGHFFGAAAEAMRRILVDHARRRKGLKYGGEHQRVELLNVDSVFSDAEELVQLDDALDRLEADKPQAAQLVKLRVFAGFTLEDSALALGVSPRTAKRLWVFAKAWLRREMDPDAVI